MSTFLTGKELKDRVYDIIWDAEGILLIVSPFIKLDSYFKKLFDKHKNNQELHLILVFGKNSKDINKSLNKTDFDYFKEFPNISIIYVPHLHAKYYGNEKKGVITSINLYDYSFKNNIEFGVFEEQNQLSRFRRSADNEAWNKCMDIADENEVVFIKRPVYEAKKMIVTLSKNYIKSDILFDSTEQFYGLSKNRKLSGKRLPDFPEEVISEHNTTGKRPEREEIKEQPASGFCIRTGARIKFDPKHPMSKEAWRSWNKYKDMDYPEKFCHKTGKPSYGKTSMRHPIL